MTRITRLVFTLLFAAFAGLSVPALADPGVEMEYTNERPLIIIRFNQPHVLYERALYNTIAQALNVRPNAMFDVVSVAPRAHSASDQDRYNQMAAQTGQKVLGTLRDMGLPQSRINYTNALDAVDFSEVRIFVH